MVVKRWSRQAAQILSVFEPRQEDDGYPAAVLATFERDLNFRVPAVLKHFYQAWGRRRKMTSFRQMLLPPNKWEMHTCHFIFAEENQAVYRWGIPGQFLQVDNPPLYYATQPTDEGGWKLSHTHLTDFLDYLTYGHALSGGAPHGGVAQGLLGAAQMDEVQHTWRMIDLASTRMGMFPDPKSRWVLYGQPGIVLDPSGEVWLAARSQDALEDVRQQLDLTWKHRW